MPTLQPALGQAPAAPGPAPAVTVQRAVEVALYLHDMRNQFVGLPQAQVEAWVRAALSKTG